MKKIVLLSFLTICLFTSLANAQGEKGVKLLNAGIGLRSYYIPIVASLEYGIMDNVTVGPMVGYASWSGWGSSLYLGARGSYHLNDILKLNNDKIDVYAGGGLGYQNWSWKGVSYVGYSNGGIYFMGFVGGRYYISNNLGAFAELGGGVAALNAGVTLKF